MVVMLATSEQLGDSLALPAFIISIASGLVGLSALIWNIVAWIRSGHRVTVEIECIVRNPGRNASWVGRRKRFWWPNAAVPPRHVPHAIVFISVIARNRGRAAVDVERLFFTVGKPAKNKNISWVSEGDRPLPERLEPGSSISREYMIAEVEAFVRREKKRRFRAAVSLGNGMTRRSPTSFNIDKARRGQTFLASEHGQILQTPREIAS